MERQKSGITANILRTLATLFVFLVHGKDYIPKISLLREPFTWLVYVPAWAGVWIFLLLSGYGIGCGFFAGRYKLKNAQNKLSIKLFIRFYLGRFVKIASLYYLYCIYYEIISGDSFFWNNRNVLIQMITFRFDGGGGNYALGHLWYISMAMQLYLIMPFIYLLLDKLLCKKKILFILFYIVAIGGLLCRLGIKHLGLDWSTYCYTNSLANLDLVFIGMICAEIKALYPLKDTITLSVTKVAAAIVFIILVFYNCLLCQSGTGRNWAIYSWILPSAYAVICSCMLIQSGIGLHIFGKNIVITYIFEKFAYYSYAFYIFHKVAFEYLYNTLCISLRYQEMTPIMQSLSFYAISFFMTLLVAIPFSWIGKIIVAKYKVLERWMFHESE